MHNQPHTAATKAKMSADRRGRPAPWRHRPTMIVNGVVLWQCGRCQWFFPRHGFYLNRRTILALTSECKSCHSRTSVKSRDRVKVRQQSVASTAQRRALMLGAGSVKISTADLQAVRALLGGVCLKCRAKSAVHFDHVQPLARGGVHHPQNLQLLCRRDNSSKRATTVDYRTDEQRAAIALRWPA